MEKHFTFKIGNSFDELCSLCRQINDLLARQSIPKQQCYVIMLALEEMISNTIKYGYDDDARHHITIKLELDQEITLTIEDDGHEFNPLDSNPEDLDAEIEDRQVGGMGIHLTREMVKSIKYSRSNATNILTLTV